MYLYSAILVSEPSGLNAVPLHSKHVVEGRTYLTSGVGGGTTTCTRGASVLSKNATCAGTDFTPLPSTARTVNTLGSRGTSDARSGNARRAGKPSVCSRSVVDVHAAALGAATDPNAYR